jgi:hypothetical protein
MAKFSKSAYYIFVCWLGLVFISTRPCIYTSNGFELNWSTPPPLVVVADINKLYRIGCRVTLNNNLFSQHQNSSLDNVELWAVISKVRYFHNID